MKTMNVLRVTYNKVGLWLLAAVSPLLLARLALAAEGCGTDVGTPGLEKLCKDGGNGSGLNNLVNGVANWMVGIILLIIVLMIVIGGVQLISAAGNPEAIKSAKSRITNAIIALAALISLRLILALVLGATS